MTDARHVTRVRSTGLLGVLAFIVFALSMLSAVIVAGAMHLKESFFIGVILHEEGNLPLLVKNIPVREISVEEEHSSVFDGFNFSGFKDYGYWENRFSFWGDSFSSAPYVGMIGVIGNGRGVFADHFINIASGESALRQSEVIEIAGNVNFSGSLRQRNLLLAKAGMVKVDIGALGQVQGISSNVGVYCSSIGANLSGFSGFAGDLQLFTHIVSLPCVDGKLYDSSSSENPCKYRNPPIRENWGLTWIIMRRWLSCVIVLIAAHPLAVLGFDFVDRGNWLIGWGIISGLFLICAAFMLLFCLTAYSWTWGWIW